MRIAMVGQKGLPARFGGVEKHVEDLSLLLAKRGFEVIVYARKWYTKGERLDFTGSLEIKHLPSLKTKHFDTITHTLLATLDAIRRRVDVIHYHGVGPSLWSFLPRILSPRVKVITTFHSIDRKHEKWGWFARLALRLGEWTAGKLSHRLIAVSRTIRQYARDVYDVEAVYIPNAVELKESDSKNDELAKFGLRSKKYILVVSRLIGHKGVHYAVEAYNSLPKGARKGLKLVIVGDGYHTKDYVKRLKILAAGNSDIVFTGFQSGEVLRQLYANALFMVHASDKEGMPIVVLEAYAHGLPVLLSDIPEHLEFSDNPDYIFEKGSVVSLTEKLKKIISYAEPELEVQGQKNRIKVERFYNWEKVVEQVKGLYREVFNLDIAERIGQPARSRRSKSALGL